MPIFRTLFSGSEEDFLALQSAGAPSFKWKNEAGRYYCRRASGLYEWWPETGIFESDGTGCEEPPPPGTKLVQYYRDLPCARATSVAPWLRISTPKWGPMSMPHQMLSKPDLVFYPLFANLLEDRELAEAVEVAQKAKRIRIPFAVRGDWLIQHRFSSSEPTGYLGFEVVPNDHKHTLPSGSVITIEEQFLDLSLQPPGGARESNEATLVCFHPRSRRRLMSSFYKHIARSKETKCGIEESEAFFNDDANFLIDELPPIEFLENSDIDVE